MKPTLRLSYSSLNVFASCPRKFEFDKLYPKPPRVFDDNYAADVGSAIHVGYQHYLAHHDKESAIWEFMKKFPVVEEWNQENDYRSLEAALATLEEMFDSIKMLEYELARVRRPNTVAESEAGLTGGVVVPATEVPFEIKFSGLEIHPCAALPEGADISVIGYIDAIMQNQINGLYRTLDIKTSRMKLLDATGKFKFDGQQVPYGIVVDHIAQGEVESFEVLYLDCYIDILEPSVQLYPFTKHRHDLQDWATNKLIQFRQIAGYAESDYFPRTDGGCLFYNRPCRYLEPCQSRDRKSLLQWFLLDSIAAEPEPFFPWITATVDLGVEA
jgi:ATP-dependent helicase/DNAse subunit B